MEKVNKDAYVRARLTESQKATIERQAEYRGMSVSGYLIWLVRQDTSTIEEEEYKRAKRQKQIKEKKSVS